MRIALELLAIRKVLVLVSCAIDDKLPVIILEYVLRGLQFIYEV